MFKRHPRPTARLVLILTQIHPFRSWRRLSVLLRVVLAAAVIWFVTTHVDLNSIIAAARNADAKWIALALVLLPANLVLEALTWQPVLRRVVHGVGLRDTLLSVVSGYPLGMVTPARLGDLAGRALCLQRGDRTEIALTAAVARLADLLAVLLAGTVFLAVTLVLEPARFPGAIPLLAVSLAALIGVLTLAATPSIIRRILSRLPLVSRIEDRLAFLDGLPRRLMLIVFLRALGRYGVYATQFLLLSFALAPAATAGPVLAAVSLTFLAKSVIPPVTFMDLGIREGAAAYFFSHFGLSAATGFDAGLMLFAVNLVLPSLMGLPLVSRYRLSGHVESPGVRGHVVESGA